MLYALIYLFFLPLLLYAHKLPEHIEHQLNQAHANVIKQTNDMRGLHMECQCLTGKDFIACMDQLGTEIFRKKIATMDQVSYRAYLQAMNPDELLLYAAKAHDTQLQQALARAFFGALEQFIARRRISIYRPLVTGLIGLGIGLAITGPLAFVGTVVGHTLGAQDHTSTLSKQIHDYCDEHGIDIHQPTNCSAHDMAHIQQILYNYYTTERNNTFEQLPALAHEFNHLYHRLIEYKLQCILHERELTP